jgi:DNA-binding protein Alba
MLEENGSGLVLIGKKPIMHYVLACITLFHGGAKEVNVKARGRSISRAVDVVEVVRHRFLPDVKITKVEIGTDQFSSGKIRQLAEIMEKSAIKLGIINGPLDSSQIQETIHRLFPEQIVPTNVSTIEITLER